MGSRAAAGCARLQKEQGGPIDQQLPGRRFARDLSAARNFINKFERNGEGFFYI